MPPDQIRFRSINVEPYPDRRRIRLQLEVTPFQVRPSVEIELIEPGGEVASSAHIVETSEPKMVVTLHLRRIATAGTYIARLTLGYPDQEPSDVATRSFGLTPDPSDHGG